MDNLFKALLIIVLGAFLYLYYINSDNGRYRFIYKDLAKVLLDSKTGTMYIITTEGIYKNDLINSTREKIELKKINFDQ